MRISIRREPTALDLPLPAYATAGAAGMDLAAALESDLTLGAGERALVSTGIRISLPHGYEAQIRPRSGLALRHGLTLLNSPGTIDSDYDGIVQVIVINLGCEPVTLRRGDRIAQMVVAPVVDVEWVAWEEADGQVGEIGRVTPRGENGFGSTGR